MATENIHELQEQRNKVVSGMKSLRDLVKTEKRTLTKDEDQKFDKMYEEKRSLDKLIQFTQEEIAAEKRIAEQNLQQDDLLKKSAKAKGTVEKQKTETRAALKAWMVGQHLTGEQRSILFGPGRGILLAGERRNQSAVTANLGAEMVREEYFNEFEKYLALGSGIVEACRVIRTKTGANLPWPVINDTANKGRRISEGGTAAVLDVATAVVNIGAFKYTGDAILVPSELEEDDSYGFISEVPEISAERVSRAFNEEATTADGSNKPQGILVGASDSTIRTAAGVITRAKILDLKHSVNRRYRNGSKVGFMFSDDVLRDIAKLSIGSTDDRPLWVPSMSVDVPSTIEGMPYFINDDMPDLSTAGNKAILFGDMSKYLVRIVREFRLKRADERHIETDTIGFYGFARMSGRCINPNALKTLEVA